MFKIWYLPWKIWAWKLLQGLIITVPLTYRKILVAFAIWGKRTRWVFPSLGIRDQRNPAAPLWGPSWKQFQILLLGSPLRGSLYIVCLRRGWPDAVWRVELTWPKTKEWSRQGWVRAEVGHTSINASTIIHAILVIKHFYHHPWKKAITGPGSHKIGTCMFFAIKLLLRITPLCPTLFNPPPMLGGSSHLAQSN